ncbi:signal recognition particle-docking protein FtsY [Nakamurella sp.]|uniref:signal recognition particle-docking protein FtsY n=1 Tax=Nakamurella sp. TaxID=1869182 RepID=UPI003B3A0B1A
MPTWIWIVIAVVVVLALALVLGTVRARGRRISLKDAPPKEIAKTDEPPAKGGYKAGGSISFSAGGGAGTALAEPPTPPASTPRPVTRPMPVVPDLLPERTEVDGQPGVGDDASVPRDAPSRDIVEVALPDDVTETVTTETVTDVVVVEPDGTVDEVLVDEVLVDEVLIDEAAVEPVREEIAPTAGRLSRLRGRLSRSQNAFGRSLLGLLGAGTLDEDSWEEVEDTLLMADLGAAAAGEITQKLRAAVAAHGVTDAASARALLRTVLIDAVDPSMDRSVRALPHDGRPSVLLIVGVNGTGKTTTTGKLARVLVADGRHVVLGAADTFRAAAADQLQTWGERAGAAVVRADAGADPAAVAFDAVKRGIADGADAVLIDTAGRLHTKTGLMDELGKVKRVIQKQAEVDEILLVLDATTGQNGLVQATVFAEVVDITGIVLTKLDGTAKGGIVVAVQRTLGVPVKLVGLGEGPDDLAPFEPAAFVDALLGD